MQDFDNQYFSNAVMDKLEKKFHNLIQGEMTAPKYKEKFTSLCRYAEKIIDDEGRKTWKFV